MLSAPRQRASRARRPAVTSEAGFALPLALSILTIVGLFVAATISFATHNTDRAVRDRVSVRALAAADAGLDTAIYRMNKAVVASEVEGLLGLVPDVLALTGCIEIDVNLQIIVVEVLDAGWCPAATSAEQVDGPANGTQAWTTATGTSQASLGVVVDLPTGKLIERKIVATGTVGDVTKRVMGTVRLSIGSQGNLVTLFEQTGYVECTAVPPDPSDPQSGCA